LSPSYDVINDVIMSDADCTPGREPRSVAASLPVFTTAVDFIQQPVQTGSAQSYAEIPVSVVYKAKFRSLTFDRWCQLRHRFDEVRINSCVQNKTALKCAKNHANWFRRFEDVNSQT